MNLCIDIGNTNTKFGLFDGYELKKVFSEPNALDHIFDNYTIQNIFLSKTGVSEAIEARLKRSRKKFELMIYSPHLRFPLEIMYATPHTLGADRVAGVVAANDTYRRQNVLKVDFGTCITFDFVNSKNQYLGGAISPGMMMRFRALSNYTARLPLIDPFQFKDFPFTGNDTATSILSGVIHGIRHEVTGAIKEYEERYGSLKVVVTGGDAGLFVTLLENGIFVRPYLVLEGLNRILQHNLE